ncbi:hypothetical protein KFK14_07805 [Sphingobium phenoxybenzoativorans]|uniref:Uncharacterized protein n=1 Tax=Sphingobium phenoxybenzoativorans TaxID=1592790 RepID=A0A975Q328_9SPHN|nr:hypothetical protein [Sphingobium phenoxybenzoativorans]QUT07301.1 hypothetical protein KFK14_07805 [Sphingobium phenoxybenzoativorans]
MSDIEFPIPPRPKPKPGSLALRKKKVDPLEGLGDNARAIITAAWDAPPPWIEGDEEWDEPLPPSPAKPSTTNLKKLKAARKKVEEYSAVLRTDAFDDWVRRCTETAGEPREWTRAALLYDSYLRHARKYGANRPAKRLAKEELATETAWGKMMGSLFGKKRRRAGQYYPLRLKQGA